MKVATVLLASAMLVVPVLAQAQTAGSTGADRSVRGDLVKVPRATQAAPARNGNDTDRAIDDEMRRIDHMTSICNGC